MDRPMFNKLVGNLTPFLEGDEYGAPEVQQHVVRLCVYFEYAVSSLEATTVYICTRSTPTTTV